MMNFKEGDKVQIFVGDTYDKVAVIEEVNQYGWVFRFVEGTHQNSGYKVGDVVFFAHSFRLSMRSVV